MSNVLVILSGCGVLDGSEIHEAVCTLLHLDRHDAHVTMAAPDGDQPQVMNHLTGQPASERRNMRVEAARIARGDITDLGEIKGGDFDAVVLPGGFGAAKNLCSFADDGASCTVHPEVERVLREAAEAGRVIGFICISPTIAARLFKAKVTIGEDPGTAAKIEQMGGAHEPHATEDICVDDEHRIVSTPAYMSAQRIGQVYDGIGRLIDQVLAMADQGVAAAK
jgi:enhancing lycopene biosynthesis protein 2